MKKKICFVGCIVGMVGIVLIELVVIKHLSYKQTQEIDEIFDNVDRKLAIEELSELRGRVVEIEYLTYENVDEEILLKQLKEIAKYDRSDSVYHNKYLDNIQIHIPEGSIEYKTEMVIEQIDDIIDTIKR